MGSAGAAAAVRNPASPAGPEGPPAASEGPPAPPEGFGVAPVLETWGSSGSGWIPSRGWPAASPAASQEERGSGHQSSEAGGDSEYRFAASQRSFSPGRH